MACRDCTFLDVTADRDRKVRVRAKHTYRCKALIPDLSKVIPASAEGRVSKRWMTPDEGEGCPTYLRKSLEEFGKGATP